MRIINRTRKNTIALRVEIANSMWRRALGLMFRKNPAPLLMIMERETKPGIWMPFMRFPIDLILLDDEYNVLDIKTLRPWKDFIRFSGVRWALELRKGLLREGSVKVGDVLEILP